MNSRSELHIFPLYLFVTLKQVGYMIIMIRKLTHSFGYNTLQESNASTSSGSDSCMRAGDHHSCSWHSGSANLYKIVQQEWFFMRNSKSGSSIWIIQFVMLTRIVQKSSFHPRCSCKRGWRSRWTTSCWHKCPLASITDIIIPPEKQINIRHE